MSISPGATLGIIGGGQLGRMLALVARRMGYGVGIYTPKANSPAGQVADFEVVAAYEDTEALQRFAKQVQVVTIEFENIPVAALQTVEAIVPVYPQPHVLKVAQNRLREKTFLSELGIPVVPFASVQDETELEAATRKIGFPLVLKTAGYGYDGKGQARVNTLQEAQTAYRALGQSTCVLEKFIDLDREISVIAARSENGEFAAYRPVENQHANHVLDITLAPATISPELEAQALQITRHIMETLAMRGVLCVEFFITKGGKLLVNELAPRTHNSGHYTIEAAMCSQFEQHLRVVCGLPLGDTRLLQPAAAMANLLGGEWFQHTPNWAACLQNDPVYLHWYGKGEAKAGRKMGHLTSVGQSLEEVLARVQASRQALGYEIT